MPQPVVDIVPVKPAPPVRVVHHARPTIAKYAPHPVAATFFCALTGSQDYEWLALQRNLRVARLIARILLIAALLVLKELMTDSATDTLSRRG